MFILVSVRVPLSTSSNSILVRVPLLCFGFESHTVSDIFIGSSPTAVHRWIGLLLAMVVDKYIIFFISLLLAAFSGHNDKQIPFNQ